ncbi:MAG: cation transporter [Acidobacteria bacterium]|nr:cation transporter [Acidobacteriota bacterium]
MPDAAHDLKPEIDSLDHLRAGLRISRVSIIWTLASSSLGLVIGLRAGSLVLVGFALTGLLDVVGSSALVLHFRHALRHETFSERREQLALRVVIGGLAVIGLAVAAQSARELIASGPAHSAPSGVVLAALSVVVLAVLADRKRRVARLIPSQALLADGWLSGVGTLLAAVTVAGTGATSLFGWWWVDPVAAGVVACGAVAVAVVLAKGSDGPDQPGDQSGVGPISR